MALNDKFRARFKKRIEKSKDKTDQFVTKLLLKIDYKLVSMSPVDKGRFKQNWMPGNGYINTATTEAVSSAAMGAYDNKNELIINAIKITGQVIYLTNSLPYARRLETGYSQKAPAGMVGITLASINSEANKIGVQLRNV